MPFRIIRNDITKMSTDAIVNTANENPTFGAGCDYAVYKAAGMEELLSYRKTHIGVVQEGEVFFTPGFQLPAKYIIHAVSPIYIDGNHGEEELLRSCYRKSLALALKMELHSIAFPLISTGSFGYPKEEGLRIAVDEINCFIRNEELLIYLVVFDENATSLGRTLYPRLEAFIDKNYVENKIEIEYSRHIDDEYNSINERLRERAIIGDKLLSHSENGYSRTKRSDVSIEIAPMFGEEGGIEHIEKGLEERIRHREDTFQQYLLFLINKKGMENAEVYKRAIIDKKVFSRIKNNPDYHPQKLTALCLCIGAKLNLDESRDLLARAGYALSPSNKMDIIFSFFIENGIYDMIELDIQLEEHGLPCIIT